MYKNITVTTADVQRLEALLAGRAAASNEGIRALQHELNRADVVEPEEISTNIVTMNSRVRVQDLDRNVEMVCTLVFPSEANAEHNRISVLAPLGTALLGSRIGRVLRFTTPGGERRMKVTAIEYQPESASRRRRSSRPVQEDPQDDAVLPVDVTAEKM